MKKKIAVGVALIAFLLAGSGLWYTRPQTFWDATGMDWDKITGASGYAIEGSVTDGTASQQIWMLDNLTPGQEDYKALWRCWRTPPTAPACKTFCRRPRPTPPITSPLWQPLHWGMNW